MKLNWFDLEVVTHMGLPDMQISMKSSLFCLEMSKCCHNANILLVGTSTSNVIVLRTIFGTEKNQQKRLWFIYLLSIGLHLSYKNECSIRFSFVLSFKFSFTFKHLYQSRNFPVCAKLHEEITVCLLFTFYLCFVCYNGRICELSILLLTN